MFRLNQQQPSERQDLHPMNKNAVLEIEMEGSPALGFAARANSVLAGSAVRATTVVPADSPQLGIGAIKIRQKATWESGDFGEVAKFTMPSAEEFMARLDLLPGSQVLDVACGTGNLAVLAARRGCRVSGLDIATNLLAQARERARREGLSIEFTEGDAEAMPYADASFDVVVSMYGVIFAPRPERVVSELCRVTRPGGLIALANWTPGGFIGKMFAVFADYLPPPGFPSPLLWGDEATVQARFNGNLRELRMTRRMARTCFPFDPAGKVEFFRRYYGPTQRAFQALDPADREQLRNELVDLETRHNVSPYPNETENLAEYLEIQARRAPRS
jgi:SAM-dependent methyltransferase